MENWNKLKTPPASALKKIDGGRLKGKTDINPQWRYEAMTSVFGECGIGWKWEIVKLWTEPAPEGQVFAFAQVNVYICYGAEQSNPIPGIGGSMLIEKEKNGLHANDEAYKMATTDALSVALKFLGVGSDIYMGKFDGSKYNEPKTSANAPEKATNQETDVPEEETRFISQNESGQVVILRALAAAHKHTPKRPIEEFSKEERLKYFRYLAAMEEKK
jgi:hypothetical protein